MTREDLIFTAAIVGLFALAIAILVVETRSIWASEELIHEGNLTSYQKLEEFHVFTFEDNTTNMEAGWLWKTYPRLNRVVRLYRRGQALVLEEVVEPSIG
jgi:hypothetical protein